MILLLEDNVMLSMPVVEIAQSLGLSMSVVSSSEEAQQSLHHPALAGVLLDMRLATTDFVKAIPESIPVAGFGPHVEGQWFLTLRQLGIRDLWPHSKLRDKVYPWLQKIAADHES